MIKLKSPVSLKAILPELAKELYELLIKEGHSKLAEQIYDLNIVDLCSCDEDFCSTFYCIPKPDGKWGADHGSIELEPDEGMIVMDIVDGKIALVEILFRDDIKQKLKEITHYGDQNGR